MNNTNYRGSLDSFWDDNEKNWKITTNQTTANTTHSGGPGAGAFWGTSYISGNTTFTSTVSMRYRVHGITSL